MSLSATDLELADWIRSNPVIVTSIGHPSYPSDADLARLGFDTSLTRRQLCKQLKTVTVEPVRVRRRLIRQTSNKNLPVTEIVGSQPAYVEESMTILDLVVNYAPPGWEEFFKNPEILEICDHISAWLEDERRVMPGVRIVPERYNIFRAFWLTPLSRVRVVIFGEDPYPGTTISGNVRAQGLAFSVTAGDDASSLKNIFAEIIDNGFNVPPNGNLEGWAQQGVLMLNTSLTCRLGEKASHVKPRLWEPLILRLLSFLGAKAPQCIYAAWGVPANKMVKNVPGNPIIISSTHPSGLSANNQNAQYPAFRGSGMFAKINSTLEMLSATPIDWGLSA